jgi:hypothetical protein
MSDPFDPYYTWLGIRPEEQPPNHYRLLGLQLFEDHLEAIEHAADRQMAHLRTFQTGQYAELSLRLLDEVAAAKRCLLEPERKAAYDAMLWEQLDDQTPTVPSAVPKGGSANTPQAAILIEKKRPRWGPSRRRSWPVSSILVAAAAVAGVVLGGLWWPWQVWPESSEAVVVVSPEIVVPQSAGRPNPTVSSSSDAAGTLPRDQWTDLLARADLARDVVCGPWSRRETAIRVGNPPDFAEQGFARLMFPAALEGSYDVEVEVTHEKTYSWASLLLPVGSQTCTMLLGVDEKAMLVNADDHVVSSVPIPKTDQVFDERPRVVRVGVRLQGENATIEATADGKPLLQWTGQQRGLSSTANWALPEGMRLGLGGFFATFHRVRLRPIGPLLAGAASREEVAEGESLPPNEWVETLQFADVDRGRVWGDWAQRGKELVARRALWTRDTGHPRLGLPVHIDGDYDLRVELTRTEEDNMVGVVLPVESYWAAVLVDEGPLNDKVAGIEQIDGLGVRHSVTSKRSTGFLTNGRRYVILCQVRTDSYQAQIDVFLNGQPFLHWKGPPQNLGSGSAWMLPEPRSVGLVASASSATFHSVHLRLISGQAMRVGPADQTP